MPNTSLGAMETNNRETLAALITKILLKGTPSRHVVERLSAQQSKLHPNLFSISLNVIFTI